MTVLYPHTIPFKIISIRSLAAQYEPSTSWSTGCSCIWTTLPLLQTCFVNNLHVSEADLFNFTTHLMRSRSIHARSMTAASLNKTFIQNTLH